ncbi:MAG: cache domain-containing protein, partial [Calditrichia bacterium]|nr:cache domain-containing protein [Calditrichia bacterium]
MKKIIFNSLKTKISLVFLLLVFVTVSGIVFYMQLEVEKANLEEQDKNVKTLLASVKLNVENQNNSIFFHKNAMIDARKEELMNVVTLAINSIQSYYSMYKKGIINEKTAKLLAMNELKKFRYKNGTGYIWINDTGKPYPHMVMHPTLPELDGKIMDSPEYNCALGKDINLFHAFIDVTEKFGEGYVHYLWPKPTNEGLTEKQPKLSYVRLFKHWNWIVGSGLYMDDIEKEVEKRIIAIENEFKKTFAKIKIAENGYMFLFNHERKVIVHPIYENMELSKLINPATGNKILDDLIEASTTLDEKINYIWDKPADMGNFIYKKVAYVTYFEPLNWYIGLSFYIDEIEASAEALRKKILIFSLIFLTA